MAEFTLNRKLTLKKPLTEVFEFFAKAENLQKICPPELDFTMLTPLPFEMRKGTLIDYNIRLYGFPLRWRTLISEWNPPHSFIDESVKGPYKQWIHRHTFTENEKGETNIEDHVRYRLPFEPLGDIGHWLVRRELKYIFDYRQRIVAQLLGS